MRKMILLLIFVAQPQQSEYPPILLKSARVMQNPPIQRTKMDDLEDRISNLEKVVASIPKRNDSIRVLQLEAQVKSKDEEISRLKAQLDRAADFDARIKVLTDQIELFKSKL